MLFGLFGLQLHQSFLVTALEIKGLASEGSLLLEFAFDTSLDLPLHLGLFKEPFLLEERFLDCYDVTKKKSVTEFFSLRWRSEKCFN